MRSAAETATKPGRVEILSYIDDDDESKFDYLMAQKELQLEPAVSSLKNMEMICGEPLSTPLMNNILSEKASGDIFVISNDDQIFRDKNWDDEIDKAAACYPDDIYCIWFNDGRYGEKICTFPVLSRRWVDILGYIEPPIFEHYNCDLWTWQIAKMLSRLHYIPNVMVEHLHPDTGKSQADVTTVKNLSGGRPERDRAMFVRFERYRILDASILREKMK